MLMFLAVSHLFGVYNPKQLADYLGIPHQQFYSSLKGWSLYYLKEMLLCFMVKQASEKLKPILEKSDATKCRAGITLSADNSVIDRVGKLLRCTWSWYSGRCKKVINGNDLLGIILTINRVPFPLHLLFCSKQGRANTDKPALLICMLKRLKEEFAKHDIDLTMFAITLDSWFVSDALKKDLLQLGFTKLIIAGKGNYTFTIGKQKNKASVWKKTLQLLQDQWGIDVPSLRIKAVNPTFGKVVLFFFHKSTTRCYYLMDFSKTSLRGAQIWHIWLQHHVIECFWKTLKSILGIKQMRLQGEGLYACLLIKVIAYLLAIRLQSTKQFFKLSITQIMRKLQKDLDLNDVLLEHFHLALFAD